MTELGDRVNLSLAHKRWSQGEAGKTENQEEIRRQQKEGDGLGENEKHQRAFFHAS